MHDNVEGCMSTLWMDGNDGSFIEQTISEYFTPTTPRVQYDVFVNHHLVTALELGNRNRSIT